MRIKDIPKNIRPRERLKDVGAENLSSSELLAIILKEGVKDKSVLDVSMNVLKLIEEDKDNISIRKLTTIKGIGEVKAIEILALLELTKRLYLKQKKEVNYLRTAEDVYNYMKYDLYNKKQEYFYSLYFDTRLNLISKKLHFIGTVNKSVVHPREIFKEAYKLNANSIICVHNHPSGNVSPSNDDKIVTKSLVEIGKLNNILINDHVIISDNDYFSFYENDLM